MIELVIIGAVVVFGSGLLIALIYQGIKDAVSKEIDAQREADARGKARPFSPISDRGGYF